MPCDWRRLVCFGHGRTNHTLPPGLPVLSAGRTPLMQPSGLTSGRALVPSLPYLLLPSLASSLSQPFSTLPVGTTVDIAHCLYHLPAALLLWLRLLPARRARAAGTLRAMARAARLLAYAAGGNALRGAALLRARTRACPPQPSPRLPLPYARLLPRPLFAATACAHFYLPPPTTALLHATFTTCRVAVRTHGHCLPTCLHTCLQPHLQFCRHTLHLALCALHTTACPLYHLLPPPAPYTFHAHTCHSLPTYPHFPLPPTPIRCLLPALLPSCPLPPTPKYYFLHLLISSSHHPF